MDKSEVILKLSTPGKVILFGEHAVVYGKTALAASLDLRTTIKIHKDNENDSDIHLNFKNLNMNEKLDLEKIKNHFFNENIPLIKNRSDFNVEYPEMIKHDEYIEMLKEFFKDQVDNYTVSEYNSMLMFLYLFVGIFSSIDCEIEPFTVFIESELTLGAGMGSSASGAICVAGAFLQYIRIKSVSVIKAKASYKKCSLATGNLEEFNEKYLDIISRWAFAAEKIMHGSPSGIDTTVCTFGSVVEFKKNSPFKRIDLSSKINMLLIDTKISRNTKTLVKNVAILREKYQTTIDHILSAIDSISLAAIECFKQINDEKNGDISCVVLDQYCRLQELVKLNQNLLSVLGVSHPTIDHICQIALNNKIEAKLTGAGGGGYTVILLSPEYSKECEKKLVNDLTQAGYGVISTTLGGAGVKIEKI